MIEVYEMKLLALAAVLFFAAASGETFFGALRIDAASNELLKATRTKIQTLAFDIAALQEKKRGDHPRLLPEYHDITLLELVKEKEAETSAYEELATRLFLEHARRGEAAPGPTNLAPAPLVGTIGPIETWQSIEARVEAQIKEHFPNFVLEEDAEGTATAAAETGATAAAETGAVAAAETSAVAAAETSAVISISARRRTDANRSGLVRCVPILRARTVR